jgi:hypothetical protein
LFFSFLNTIDSYSHKLRHVKDDISLTGNYTEDIDNQSDDNYTYDAIGNLANSNLSKRPKDF